MRSLGAQVTVAARKQADLAWAQVEGMHGVFYEELPAYAGGFDYVVNTVPALVLGGQVLEKLQADCLLVEIASAPGGNRSGGSPSAWLKVIKASSLPGKVAAENGGENHQRYDTECHQRGQRLSQKYTTAAGLRGGYGLTQNTAASAPASVDLHERESYT